MLPAIAIDKRQVKEQNILLENKLFQVRPVLIYKITFN